MSTTITIPNVRQQTTVSLEATLSDNGVLVDWSTMDSIHAFIYSNNQKIVAGKCTAEVDENTSTILHCTYDACKPQFLGVQKLVIVCTLSGQKNTYDKPAFAFVATTDETAGSTQTEDDPVEVDIDVTDVDTSILAGAIEAALLAAEAANAAAGHAPYIGENGNWFIWSSTQNAYADSGVSATGPQGPAGADGADGVDGGILYPTFHIDAAMHLQMSDAGDSGNQRFEVDDAGHFIMTI